MASVAATPETEHVPDLLAGLRSSDVETSPYAHLVRKNVLPLDLYHALESDFPSLETMLGSREQCGNNEAIRMTAVQVLTEKRVSRQWQDFFAYHSSQDFWRRIVALFDAQFRRRFPDLEERVGRPFEEWRVVPRGMAGEADIRLDCQFVMNTPVTEVSSVKAPHIDLCDKIFSGLYYFRADQDEVAGGDLELYAWHRRPRFIKHRALMSDIDLAKTVDYAANTFVCFVNSDQAIHGVSPRGITDIPRRYINFIAEMPNEAFHPTQINRFHRLFLPKHLKLSAPNDAH